MLARMVSECAAFQERVGLSYPDTEAEAKLVNGEGANKRIFYPAIEDLNGVLDRLPAAIISESEDWTLPMIAGGARNYFHGPQGTLELILMDHDRHPGKIEASKRDFMNFVGLTLQGGDPDEYPGLAELAALDDRLIINEMTQLDPPELCAREVEAQLQRGYWSARFQVRYGLSQ